LTGGGGEALGTGFRAGVKALWFGNGEIRCSGLLEDSPTYAGSAIGALLKLEGPILAVTYHCPGTGGIGFCVS